MKLHLPLLTLSLLLFTACGGGTSKSYPDQALVCQSDDTYRIFEKQSNQNFQVIDPSDEPNILIADSEQESPTFNKKALYTLFQTEYYWAEETPDEFDYDNYNTPQALINQLKNSKDRWSIAMTKERYSNMVSQKAGGFGLKCQDVETGCLVTYVVIDSPIDKMGLKRGDIITKIDDKNATHALIYSQGKELEKLVNFSIIRKNSSETCSGSVTPRDYTFKVAKSLMLETPEHEKVGYFRLDSFMGAENIVAQIDTAFNQFKKEQIEKLVIDLRYNGGGSITVASKLLDKLTTSHTNKEQFTLAWNDDYKKNNQSYYFQKDSNSLELEQILFLTTQNSASASELVISAMKPYLNEDVVIVGDRTHGKPVGMGGRENGDYYYFLINFVVKNSTGFYNYFNGLPVTNGCDITDDPYHEMGDPKESMLKAALRYVDTGSCK